MVLLNNANLIWRQIDPTTNDKATFKDRITYKKWRWEKSVYWIFVFFIPFCVGDACFDNVGGHLLTTAWLYFTDDTSFNITLGQSSYLWHPKRCFSPGRHYSIQQSNWWGSINEKQHLWPPGVFFIRNHEINTLDSIFCPFYFLLSLEGVDNALKVSILQHSRSC